LPFLEFIAWAKRDEAGSFNTEDSREGHGGSGMPLSREEFGAFEAEGFDLNEDLACFRCRDRALFKFESFWVTGLVEDCCFHGCHCD
jgi:hypothetical protein